MPLITADLSLKLLGTYVFSAIVYSIVFGFFQFSSWVINEAQDVDLSLAENEKDFAAFALAFFPVVAAFSFGFAITVLLLCAVTKYSRRHLRRWHVPLSWVPDETTRNALPFVVPTLAAVIAMITVIFEDYTVTMDNTDPFALFNSVAWAFFVGLLGLAFLPVLILLLHRLDYDPEVEEVLNRRLGRGAGYGTVGTANQQDPDDLHDVEA